MEPRKTIRKTGKQAYTDTNTHTHRLCIWLHLKLSEKCLKRTSAIIYNTRTRTRPGTRIPLN